MQTIKALRKKFKEIDPEVRVSNHLLKNLINRDLVKTLTKAQMKKMIQGSKRRGRRTVEEIDYKQVLNPDVDFQQSRDWQWGAWD